MNFIDNLLNRLTMYRLVLYYLIALVAAAAIFGALGILPYSPLAIIASALVATTACWLANTALAKIFRVPTNFESVYITALILALIIPPTKMIPFDNADVWFLILASALAMASKYILAIHRKHIFNPAAIAVVITAFAFGQYASWWAGGNLPLLAVVVTGGLLVVRKIQRFDLVLAFFATAIASIVLTNSGFDPVVTAGKALVHTSMLFVAFVMLTEPLTTPPTRPLRIAYGALIGALFSPAVHFGAIYSTPELALIVGNIFSYIVSPKQKYKLALTAKTKIADNTYDFAFAVDSGKHGGAGTKIAFAPGQYMEFTLDGDGADSRGNRRYFTIASSPTEPELHLGIKFYEPSSSFKKKMLTLAPGETIMGGQLAGDFTLPRETTKLAFIAGGIGITPFRSMIKYLSGRTAAARADIVLLYSNRTASEIAYRDVFDEAARAIGLKTIYLNTETDGRITANFIQKKVIDWHERIFYLSGPRAMVITFETVLHELGVPRRHVKTDFFPGFDTKETVRGRPDLNR